MTAFFFFPISGMLFLLVLLDWIEVQYSTGLRQKKKNEERLNIVQVFLLIATSLITVYNSQRSILCFVIGKIHSSWSLAGMVYTGKDTRPKRQYIVLMGNAALQSHVVFYVLYLMCLSVATAVCGIADTYLFSLQLLAQCCFTNTRLFQVIIRS